jgi:hypothetical protein
MTYKEDFMFGTKEKKPDALDYFEAGRYVSMLYPEAGSCVISEEQGENGYYIRVTVDVYGGRHDA